VECLFYLFLFYSIIGPALGLPGAGIGGLTLALVAGLCAVSLGFQSRDAYSPVAWLLACAFSFLLIEIIVHGASVTDQISRYFVTWVVGLFIVQSLLRRRGFLHRFIFVLFLIGVAALPYLGSIRGGYALERAVIESDISGNLGNANGLGMWFGFCAVYFIILGLQAKNGALRLGSWLLGAGCLYVVGLTVSRGALLATAIAVLFAIQDLLKRAFIPLLLLIVFAWVVAESGVFSTAASLYSQRGTEETGRLLVWPLAIDRFLDAPLLGVGTRQIETYVHEHGKAYVPHNAFIFLGLSSGVFPLLCFAGYWIRQARRYSDRHSAIEARPLRRSLLVYTLIAALVGDLEFMAPWGLLAMAPGVMAASFVLRRTRQPLPGLPARAKASWGAPLTAYRSVRWNVHDAKLRG
jgi:hypothetical protein